MGQAYTGGAAAAEDGWCVKVLTSGLIQATAADGTASNSSSSAAAVNLNAWNQVGGVFTSATLRNAVLNGVVAANSTTSRSPSATVDKTFVGVKYLQNNAKSTSAGLNYIGEVAFWDVALTAAEWSRLALGDSPLSIRSANLIGGYNLISGDSNGDEKSYIGSAHMVEQGTVPIQTIHPPVNYFYLNTLKKSFQSVNRASTF